VRSPGRRRVAAARAAAEPEHARALAQEPAADQLVPHVRAQAFRDREDRLLVERVLADPRRVLIEEVDLDREVVVGPHPALTRELAQADRVAARDRLPLAGRDLAERASAS